MPGTTLNTAQIRPVVAAREGPREIARGASRGEEDNGEEAAERNTDAERRRIGESTLLTSLGPDQVIDGHGDDGDRERRCSDPADPA